MHRMTDMERYLGKAILIIALALCLAPFAAFAAKADKVDVIVVYDAKPTAAEKARVQGLGGETRREFKNFNMRVISISENALKSLEKGKGVKFVAPDRETFAMALTTLAPSAPTVSAAKQTARMPADGSVNAAYRGSRVGVAIVDSGIGLHYDLNPYVRQYDFSGGANPQPETDDDEIDSYNDSPRGDALGHGTHVAGILSGNGGASSGQHKGVATSANLLSLKVLDDQGRGVASDAIAAMDLSLIHISEPTRR